MYEVRHPKRFDMPDDIYLLVATNLPTLEEAKAARSMSGDLVYHVPSKRAPAIGEERKFNSITQQYEWIKPKYFRGDNAQIVTDDSWLFDWELKREDCYAKQAIRWQAFGRRPNATKQHNRVLG